MCSRDPGDALGWLNPGGEGELVVQKWGQRESVGIKGAWAARHVKHGASNWPEHQCCLN